MRQASSPVSRADFTRMLLEQFPELRDDVAARTERGRPDAAFRSG